MSNQGNVIDFLKRVPSKYREDAICRAYGRHRQRLHQMHEAAEKRKRQERLQGAKPHQ